jgi:hypothetical protein
MIIKRMEKEAPDGLIKFYCVDIGKVRFLIGKSESNWYDKNKKRAIPIWIEEKGLFIYKYAFKIKSNQSKNKKNIEFLKTSKTNEGDYLFIGYNKEYEDLGQEPYFIEVRNSEGKEEAGEPLFYYKTEKEVLVEGEKISKKYNIKLDKSINNFY